jgi:hypothetical protein
VAVYISENFFLRRVHLHGKGTEYVFSRDMISPKMQHGFAMALVEKGGWKINNMNIAMKKKPSKRKCSCGIHDMHHARLSGGSS